MKINGRLFLELKNKFYREDFEWSSLLYMSLWCNGSISVFQTDSDSPNLFNDSIADLFC